MVTGDRWTKFWVGKIIPVTRNGMAQSDLVCICVSSSISLEVLSNTNSPRFGSLRIQLRDL